MKSWVSALQKELKRVAIPCFYTLLLEEQVDSTNLAVARLAKLGQKEGTVCIALSQTQGQGRMGRSFYSPYGSGLYFSLLLRPTSPEAGLFMTAAAGVAMAKAVELAGKPASIKWVNDILVENRKVCGILAKGIFDEPAPCVVLGVGINLCPPKGGFPEELKGVAGSVFSSLPSPQETADLLACFLKEFYAYYKNLEAKEYWQEYHNRNWLMGKTVTAGAVTGTVTGIDNDFRLLITDEKGIEHPIFAGEVTLGTKNLV